MENISYIETNNLSFNFQRKKLSLKMPNSAFKKESCSTYIFQAKVNDQAINWQSEFLILLQNTINLRKKV